jgi:hypothetical protein
MLGAKAATGSWEGLVGVFIFVVLILVLSLVRLRNR